MVKNKDVHIRTGDELYKKMAKASIDLGVTRTEFIEKAIEFYLEKIDLEKDEKVK